jgi:hypothetical protein
MARTCELAVVDGRVLCPSKGNIEVDVCEACPHLRAFRDDEDGTKLLCAPPRAINAVAFAALAWPFAPEESLSRH